MGRGRRSRSSSPRRGRRSRSYSSDSYTSSDYSGSSSSSYSPSPSRRKARRSSSPPHSHRRSSRDRSPRRYRRSRSRDRSRRSRSRDRWSRRSSRRSSRERSSRRSSRDRRRSRSRSRDRRRSHSRSRDRRYSSRGESGRRSREHDSRSHGKDDKKARESAAQKMKEQLKALLKKAEASDDVLREQFEERYYRDSEKVRWERFNMDSSAPLDESEQEAGPAVRHTAVPPSAELAEAQRQAAIEDIDSEKFTQKAFISRRLPIASAAKTTEVSGSVSKEHSHEAAIFGASGDLTSHSTTTDSQTSSMAMMRIDSSSNDPLMTSLLDEEKATREARWREKLHQLRQKYAQRRDQAQQS